MPTPVCDCVTLARVNLLGVPVGGRCRMAPGAAGSGSAIGDADKHRPLGPQRSL